MTDKTLEIKGFEKLLEALRDAPKKVMPYLKKAMTLSVRAVQQRVAEYPPATKANQPGRMRTVTLKRKDGNVQVQRPMGYYERGRGWWYPVLKEKTLGEKIGVAHGAETAKRAAKRNKVKSISAAAGYKLAKGGTSEMMGRSWDAHVFAETGESPGIVGVVGNNTSYADYLQGGQQSKLHEAIGWKTVAQALEESQDDIEGFFAQAMDEWLKREI